MALTPESQKAFDLLFETRVVKSHTCQASSRHPPLPPLSRLSLHSPLSTLFVPLPQFHLDPHSFPHFMTTFVSSPSPAPSRCIHPSAVSHLSQMQIWSPHSAEAPLVLTIEHLGPSRFYSLAQTWLQSCSLASFPISPPAGALPPSLFPLPQAEPHTGLSSLAPMLFPMLCSLTGMPVSCAPHTLI